MKTKKEKFFINPFVQYQTSWVYQITKRRIFQLMLVGLFFRCQISTRVNPWSIFAKTWSKIHVTATRCIKTSTTLSFDVGAKNQTILINIFVQYQLCWVYQVTKTGVFNLCQWEFFFRSKIGSRVDPKSIFCWKSVKSSRNVIKKSQHPDKLFENIR